MDAWYACNQYRSDDVPFGGVPGFFDGSVDLSFEALGALNAAKDAKAEEVGSFNSVWLAMNSVCSSSSWDYARHSALQASNQFSNYELAGVAGTGKNIVQHGYELQDGLPLTNAGGMGCSRMYWHADGQWRRVTSSCASTAVSNVLCMSRDIEVMNLYVDAGLPDGNLNFRVDARKLYNTTTTPDASLRKGMDERDYRYNPLYKLRLASVGNTFNMNDRWVNNGGIPVALVNLNVGDDGLTGLAFDFECVYSTPMPPPPPPSPSPPPPSTQPTSRQLESTGVNDIRRDDASPIVVDLNRSRYRELQTSSSETSRIIQWEHSFRQPAHGDQQSELFTGPTIPDCASDDVPDSHCCRARTTFWISKDTPEVADYEDPNGDEQYWYGYQGVTKCREICEQQHLRTGQDTQCVPVTDECNNWEGLDGDAFTYSSLVLQQAYCLCGMKLSEVPFSGRSLSEYTSSSSSSSWQWPDPAPQTIDAVTGGHMDTSAQCYASAIKFRVDVSTAMDDADIKTCHTVSGTDMRYTEMSYSDIQQTDPANFEAYSIPYPDCSEGATSEMDCCATERVDRMATHYYARATYQFVGPLVTFTVDMPLTGRPETSASGEIVYPNANALSDVFQSKRPFGNLVSSSGVLFLYDFNNDLFDDVVVGNRLFLSSIAEDPLHPAGDGENERQWDVYTHLGEEFGSKPIVAIDAIVNLQPDGSNDQFVCIAYEDNSVILYKATFAPLITYFMTLSSSDVGTPTSCRLFTQYVTIADHDYVRLSSLVTYADHPDEIHNYEYPRSSTSSYQTLTRVIRPFDDTLSDDFQNIPSLCSALFQLPSEYPYTTTVPGCAVDSMGRYAVLLTRTDVATVGTMEVCHVIIKADIESTDPTVSDSGTCRCPTESEVLQAGASISTKFMDVWDATNSIDGSCPFESHCQYTLIAHTCFAKVCPAPELAGPSNEPTTGDRDTTWYATIGTPVGFFNQLYLEIDGYQPRPFGSTSNTMTSVAVATLATGPQPQLDRTHVCFANLQSQNLCISIDHSSTAFLPGTRVPDMSVASTEFLFGDEATAGIHILDTDSVSPAYNKLVDVYTIELSGNVRLYRGIVDYVLNVGPGVVPEPLEASTTHSRQLQSPIPQTFNTAQLDGSERFLAQSTFGFGLGTGSNLNDKDDRRARFLIVHHYNPASTGSGSCSQRCHGLDRLGYESFMLFGPNIRGTTDDVTIEYYTNGEPTRCLCGPTYGALKAPFPPPLPPDAPPPPRPPPSPPPEPNPSMPPPNPPAPAIRSLGVCTLHANSLLPPAPSPLPTPPPVPPAQPLPPVVPPLLPPPSLPPSPPPSSPSPPPRSPPPHPPPASPSPPPPPNCPPPLPQAPPLRADKESRLIFHDLTPLLPSLRQEGTAFVPHSVKIERSGPYKFFDEP